MKKKVFLAILSIAIFGQNLQATPASWLDRLGVYSYSLSHDPYALNHWGNLDNRTTLLEVFEDDEMTRRDYAMGLIKLEAHKTSDEKKLSSLCEEYIRFLRCVDLSESELIEHLLWMRKNTPNLWGALPTDSKALIPPAAIHYDESEPLRAWLATVVRGGFKLHGGRRY